MCVCWRTICDIRLNCTGTEWESAFAGLLSSPGNHVSGNLNGSVPCYVSISMNKVGSVQELDVTFWSDFYLHIAWRDDRQAPGDKSLDPWTGDAVRMCSVHSVRV
jgi:hypothetical protein